MIDNFETTKYSLKLLRDLHEMGGVITFVVLKLCRRFRQAGSTGKNKPPTQLLQVTPHRLLFRRFESFSYSNPICGSDLIA